MAVQDYDAYALTNYSFAVRKTNNYFSVTTLLLSVLIIALAILINFQTVSHIWIPRQQLPIIAAERLDYPQPLTETIVCFNGTFSGSPTATVQDVNFNTLTTTSLTQQEVEERYPSIANNLSSYTYGCIDLNGLTFDSTNKQFFIEVAATDATIFYRTIDEQGVLKGTENTLLEQTCDSTVRTFYSYFQFLQAEIAEKVYVDYDPEELVTLRSRTRFFSLPKVATTTNCLFKVLLYEPDTSLGLDNYNIASIKITRHSIGTILGSVLSWLSILTMVALFIAPIMENTLMLILAETLFQLPASLQNPSLLKYLVATFKKGLFPKEDRYVQLINKIGRMTDISNVLRLSKTLQRITPTQISSEDIEVFVSQQSFEQPEEEIKGLQKYSEASGQKIGVLDSPEEEPVSILTKIRKSVLTMLDNGSDEVSVNYNSNYGSKTSVIATVAFAACFLAFLVLFGVLNLDSEKDLFGQVIEYAEHTLGMNDLIIVMSTGTNLPAVRVLDGNFNIIETLTMRTGSQCIDSVTDSSKLSTITSTGSFYMCLPKAVDLKQSLQASDTLQLQIDNQGVSVTVNIFHNSDPSMPEELQVLEVQFSLSSSNANSLSTSYFEQELGIYTDGDQTWGQLRGSSVKKQNQASKKILGGVIVLGHEQTVLEEEEGSFFDMVENLWTFAIICFSFLLIKLTKYVNLKVKQEKVTQERADFRDNLCVLLAKVSGLERGRFNEELSKQRIYLKEEMKLQE